MNKEEMREAFAGAGNDELYQAVLELLAEFREECVQTAKDLTLPDKVCWASVGAVAACDDFKAELEAQVRKAAEDEEG
jgi:hypothetical protein